MPDSPITPDIETVDVNVAPGYGHVPVETMVIGQPAAGAAASVTFPLPVRVVAVTAKFVASAAVASRIPVVLLKTPNGDLVAAQPVSQAVTAGLTVTNSWAHAGGLPVATGRPAGNLPDIVLPAHSVVTVTADLIDVADQFSQVTVSYEPMLG